MFNTHEFLFEKIKSWNQSKADELHGLAPKGFPTKAKYIWETVNTDKVEGFVFYGPNHATYMNANGEEWILTAISYSRFDNDWTAYNKLYTLASAQGLRIVNPIGLPQTLTNNKKVKSITLEGTPYYYYRLLHPNKELGWQSNITAQTVDQIFNTYISEVSTILPLIREVVENTSIEGYPKWRFPDNLENSQGRYYRWMFDWTSDKEMFYFKLIGTLESVLQTYTNEVNGFSPSFDVKKEAEEKWQILLNM
jgi:hypothetical protein